MNAKHIGILLLAGVALAGCGGGSSSGSAASVATPTPVTITATNQGAVTTSAINTASQSLGSSYASSVGGVQTSTNSSNDRILFNAADFALQQMAQQQKAPASVIGAVTTTACTVSGNSSVDTDGTSTTATYYKVTFNNCVYVAGGPTYNGSINITGVTRTGTTALSAAIDFNFTASGSSAFSLVGGFNISASGMGTTLRTDTLSGTSIVVSVGTASMSLTNFSFISAYDTTISPVIYTNNINYNVAVTNSANTANNFAYGFATTQSNLIVKSALDTYPRSGQVVITGAASSALRVTILATSGSNVAGTSTGLVKLELSTDGGVTYPAINATIKTWATL